RLHTSSTRDWSQTCALPIFITQTPRFKAAVSVASVSNLISFYSTSLYQDLIHTEFGGFPWDNYELLWQWSPLRYVKQALTPTLRSEERRVGKEGRARW